MALAASAVLVKSEAMPAGTKVCQGYDFNNGVDYQKLFGSFQTQGFQGTNLGEEEEREGEENRDCMRRACWRWWCWCCCAGAGAGACAGAGARAGAGAGCWLRMDSDWCWLGNNGRP